MTRQQSRREEEEKEEGKDQHVKQEQPMPNQGINSNTSGPKSKSSDDQFSK